MNTVAIIIVVLLLLIGIFAVMMMMNGKETSDLAPSHQWKKIYANTDWTSGSDVSLNTDGFTLNQCMNHTLANNRPGFTYHTPTQRCILKNSYGQGSKKPNSPGWVTYIT